MSRRTLFAVAVVVGIAVVAAARHGRD